ncbi:MAG: bifunctional 2-C-methyl-D-erythritol 4-phosphate cytidylyltransferase/2-C-methyl-D-erythritol 2,4-cyclodiphosphate synthase [Caulobacteraceae bacterium]|nr:bifunctional 2-C-methyl-D-erythritol 4-phosphate cytidylyltransferase/2-C-methyl-D-erythritol 2,4-cyclodiphosphate synthase [Caulobacteraceae bacterium]
MIFDAIIAAGGSGVRAGGPKQWRSVAGRPVIRWSAEAMLAAGARQVVAVIPPGAETEAIAALDGLTVMFVAGGTSRARSVRNGLQALADNPPQAVMVHDAARPFLTPSVVGRLIDALPAADGAIPGLPVADTLKRAERERIAGTVARDGLWQAQTPQAFHYDRLVAAHDAWPADEAMTDDAAAIERAGGQVAVVVGDPRLMKLTWPEDFEMAEAIAGSLRRTRVGQGFDAHRWGPGDGVWLCGVRIAHDRTLLGHSDADAGLHALTDALLGALGEGDIGDHFPPTDPQWKGASSDRFLAHAAALVGARGGRIANVDVTLICERPKVKPHRDAMRARLAELLNLPLDAVSVKATTTEGMGFTGREEGLAAQAIVSLELPV